SKRYMEGAAEIFVDLARTLEDITLETSLKEAGIKNITVQDTQTKEKVRVTSVEYLAALLLRFAAAVWTQMAMKLTPSVKGWALGYDASITVDFGKPTVKMEEYFADERIRSREFYEFERAYTELMGLYRHGISVRDWYLNAVSCLRAAMIKVRAVQEDRREKIHKYMDPSHLEGLALGLRGEAQFWQFNISERLPQLTEKVRSYFNRDKEETQGWLDGIVASELELKQFLDCLELYKNLGDGFAGALRLYKEAAEKCLAGKDQDTINNRIKETEKLTSNNPIVFVLDPKPVL
nr:hypothetical protein [Candidatus Njordarchaeum guaymaensis]